MVKIRRIEEARDIGRDRWEGMNLEQRVLLHTDELMVVWLKIPPGTEFLFERTESLRAATLRFRVLLGSAGVNELEVVR